MLTVLCLLVVLAFVAAVASWWYGHPPLTVAVFLLALVELIRCLPLR